MQNRLFFRTMSKLMDRGHARGPAPRGGEGGAATWRGPGGRRRVASTRSYAPPMGPQSVHTNWIIP